MKAVFDTILFVGDVIVFALLVIYYVTITWRWGKRKLSHRNCKR